MTTITKELNLLDIEDIEKAASEFLEREVAISDIECVMQYGSFDEDDLTPGGIFLIFTVDDEEFDSYELFVSDDDGEYRIDGKSLSLNAPWLPKEEIFNFDVSAFKSFETIMNYDD